MDFSRGWVLCGDSKGACNSWSSRTLFPLPPLFMLLAHRLSQLSTSFLLLVARSGLPADSGRSHCAFSRREPSTSRAVESLSTCVDMKRSKILSALTVRPCRMRCSTTEGEHALQLLRTFARPELPFVRACLRPLLSVAFFHSEYAQLRLLPAFITSKVRS